MKCVQWSNRRCVYDSEHDCISCMKKEIDYYRKRIREMKEGSIAIREYDLILAQCKAFDDMVKINPAIALLDRYLFEFAAITLKKLFEEER